MSAQDQLRQLPNIDRLLQTPCCLGWCESYGRGLVLEALRDAVDAARELIRQGAPYGGEAGILREAEERLRAAVTPTLRSVINATGVILHTNLGRAPLSQETLQAMAEAGRDYSNLEFDLDEGHRGSRYVHAEALLQRLSGAQAALLVNNNAGAVLLALSALAKGGEVIISRGQLVEIGGGFRIPDVMTQSGACLVEVGTTNRTYIADYARAITERTVALMRVHSSNFRLTGFAHEASLAELAELAHQRNLLVLDDLGSGTLIDTAPYGLGHEPTVQESIAGGADLVTFSGDKLLGGPQAGIIVGKADLIARLREFPLTRALRVDKTTIAGVQANLLHYVRGEAVEKIPIWQMIASPAEDIATRAGRLLEALGEAACCCQLRGGRSAVGGGSLPGETLPTTLIAVTTQDSSRLARELRDGDPPVVARVQDEQVVLDLRTVPPHQEEPLIGRLRELLQPSESAAVISKR